MAENAKDYLHSDELNEDDSIFDPGGKQEYTEEQLIRFAELWADRQFQNNVIRIEEGLDHKGN
jgi:hypothetical protein|tara:strand:+ start:5503 stop:5691 length:189 start_codon:yes stop_codon:yes gene_type:complete